VATVNEKFTRPAKSFPIRLTGQEKQLLDQLAKDRGTTKHNLLRQCVRVLVGLPTTIDVLEAVKDKLDLEQKL
jgi:predicted DNA-binding protein